MTEIYGMIHTPDTLFWGDAEALADQYLNWLHQEDIERWEKVAEYKQWYYGEMGAPLTNRQKEFLNLQSDDEVNANYAKLVVDEVSRRLRITGFEPTVADKAVDDAANKIKLWWRKNAMAAKSVKVHRAAVRDGDSYLVVDWHNKAPRFTLATAYDGLSGISVRYDANNQYIIYAVHRWSVPRANGEIRRMDVYHADRIERFVSEPEKNRGKWVGYDEDDQPAVIPWTDGSGKPLGIPIFHFTYQALDTPFGFSALEAIIPIQIAINKAMVDLLAAADTTGFRIYWMIGKTAKDKDGNPLKISPGIWVSMDDHPNDVSMGTFEPSDIRPLIETWQELKITVAQVTETPMHIFQVQGQSSSEGSLRQQGVGLAAKIEEAAFSLEFVWENALLFALNLDNVFGSGKHSPEDMFVDVLWDDFDVLGREERTQIQAGALAELVAAGVDAKVAYKLVKFGFNGLPLSDFKTQRIPMILGGVNETNNQPADSGTNTKAKAVDGDTEKKQVKG